MTEHYDCESEWFCNRPAIAECPTCGAGLCRGCAEEGCGQCATSGQREAKREQEQQAAPCP